jgi:hypothetical protein
MAGFALRKDELSAPCHVEKVCCPTLSSVVAARREALDERIFT